MSTQTKQPDAYDDAIAYLTEHPEMIFAAWRDPGSHVAGILFARAENGSQGCGCLTEIRYGNCRAETPELTDAIMADDRIPSGPSKITVESLTIFAHWQRRIDTELGRTPPERMSL